MPTVTLTAVASAFPSITNRIRASVAVPTAPLAIVDAIIDTTSGHPQRLYTFFGLPRNNYIFRLDEIDGSNNVVTPLTQFNVVPGQVDGLLMRADEQIKVDETIGFTGNETTFTFDGTGGKPDYRTWDIVPSELDGRGILKKGIDYSWDKVTGTFNLLISGDKFQSGQVYNIHFNDIVNQTGNSIQTINDFKINLVVTSTVLDSTYFGNKLVIEPASDYIEILLPDIATVVDGRPLDVEVDAASICCVRFKAQTSQIIKFLRGNIYALPKESFTIYKYTRGSQAEWRVCNDAGNFKNVGQNVADDFPANSVFNKKLFDGSIELVTKYARIYNEVVLNLPSNQRCNFDDWNTGNNKYLYSLANSTDPSNAGKFHFPNRLGIYERNNNTGKAGDFFSQSLQDHAHIFAGDDSLTGWTQDIEWQPVKAGSGTARIGDLSSGGGLGHFIFYTSGVYIKNNAGIYIINSSAETIPNSYLINRYTLI